MKINSELITDLLKEKNCTCHNLCDTEILNIQKLEADISLSEHVLYIAASSDPLAENFKKPLILADTFEISDIFTMIQNFLNNDYRKTSALLNLYTNITELTLDDAVMKISAITGCPVIILNISYSVVSRYPRNRFNLPAKSAFRAYLRADSEENVKKLPPLFSCPYISSAIVKENHIAGYCIFLNPENHSSKLLERYMHPVLHLLSLFPTLSIANTRSLRESFISNLLNSRYADKTTVENMMNDLGFEKSEKYYLFSVYANSIPLFSLKQNLENFLEHECYLYKNYCIVILDEFSIDLHPELLVFLKKHDLFAGLSNAFFDFSFLPVAFEQSIQTISLHRHFNQSSNFSCYNEVVVSHLLKIASEQGVNLLSLCHPIVIHIHNYDQEYRTSYLETLYAYISNNLSIQQTADVLFLHRNTAYMRIKFLKDYFQINFNKYRTLFKLQISFMIFSYLGIVDTTTTANIMGPLL